MQSHSNQSNKKTSKPGSLVVTKNLFFNSSLRERFVPTYFGIQDQSQLPQFPFLGEMLKNHLKCPYWTLLSQTCPCNLDIRKPKGKGKRKLLSVPVAVGDTANQRSVFLFVRRVILKVLPTSALANTKNVKEFLKHVKTLLSLPKFGKMSSQFLATNIQTKHIKWIKRLNQQEQRLEVLRAIEFIIESFVCPLIQSFFYVTQSNCSNRLLFYRKKVWHRLLQTATKQFSTRCKLKYVSESFVDDMRSKGRCLGISAAQFLPQKSSLRPIVNCSRKHMGRVSVNDHLKGLHLILSRMYKNKTVFFGASILGVEELHGRWREYKMKMKNKRVRRYYFVKADLIKCFDMINPGSLYNIVKEILGDTDSFSIYKYKKQFVLEKKTKSYYFESLDKPDVICNSFTQVQINCLGSYVVSKDVLLEKLHSLLFCNVIKIGSQHFTQNVGISQGSCISSLLCAAYFAHIDKSIYADTEVLGPHNFLVRMTDDILFVTPHKNQAKEFLHILLNGMSENCKVNFEKCCANFKFVDPSYGEVKCVSQHEPMRYCGLLFHQSNFEVTIDHSNYINVKAQDTVSWSLTQNPGMVFKKKMCHVVWPKSYSILFDCDINSIETIEHNILCIFAVCAVKFHYLISMFPQKQRVTSNPTFFESVILGLPKVLVRHVSKNLKRCIELGAKGKKAWSFPIPERKIQSMCNLTFIYKLQTHHNMYAPLIDNLRRIEKKRCRKSVVFSKKQIGTIFDVINIKS